MRKPHNDQRSTVDHPKDNLYCLGADRQAGTEARHRRRGHPARRPKCHATRATRGRLGDVDRTSIYWRAARDRHLGHRRLGPSRDPRRCVAAKVLRVPGTARPMTHTDKEIQQAAKRFERLADAIDPPTARVEDTDDLRAIAIAADAVRAGDAHLREAVLVARAQGRSWNHIALALGVTRQAARQRFADSKSSGPHPRRQRTNVRSGAHATIPDMAQPNRRTVSPNPDGGWDVQKPGASRASSHHDTQADAQTAARRYLGNDGGGELVTQGRNGQIRGKDTVPPGHDPFPPKG